MPAYRPDKIYGREYVATFIGAHDYDLRYDHAPLKPTGRWFIQFSENSPPVLFVEHKGWFCGRAWIPEGLIVYRQEERRSPIYGE